MADFLDQGKQCRLQDTLQLVQGREHLDKDFLQLGQGRLLVGLGEGSQRVDKDNQLLAQGDQSDPGDHYQSDLSDQGDPGDQGHQQDFSGSLLLLAPHAC